MFLILLNNLVYNHQNGYYRAAFIMFKYRLAYPFSNNYFRRPTKQMHQEPNARKRLKYLFKCDWRWFEEWRIKLFPQQLETMFKSLKLQSATCLVYLFYRWMFMICSLAWLVICYCLNCGTASKQEHKQRLLTIIKWEEKMFFSFNYKKPSSFPHCHRSHSPGPTNEANIFTLNFIIIQAKESMFLGLLW